MARILMLLGLTVCLCALQVSAYVTDEEFKRALLTLRILEEQNEERRFIVDCKAEGEGCTGIIHCCGTLQCFWEDGYTVLKKGECVQCVKQGQKCQRDSQCCGGPPYSQHALQCNKGNKLWVDGTCEVYRSYGSCYRDGQCVNDCNRKWYQTHGTCH